MSDEKQERFVPTDSTEHDHELPDANGYEDPPINCETFASPAPAEVCRHCAAGGCKPSAEPGKPLPCMFCGTVGRHRCAWLAESFARHPEPEPPTPAAEASGEMSDDLYLGIIWSLVGKVDDVTRAALVAHDAALRARLAGAEASLHNVRLERGHLAGELEAARKDVEDAAGELLVSIPPPGTEGAKLLLANVAMRRERDKAREEKHTLRAEVERLRGLLAECNAVCLCGCPAEAHESYGEDGEACGKGHDCMRVPRSVATSTAALRAAITLLVEAGDCQINCNDDLRRRCGSCRDGWQSARVAALAARGE